MKLLNRLFHFVETLPTSDRVIFKTLVGLSFGCLLWSLTTVSTYKTILIPFQGGGLHEGIVGTPRFINPLLAVTAADKDMVALVFAGLMRVGDDGTLTPDLAESVTVSDDGLTYNVILKKGLVFQDGTPITSDDALFTIVRAQDPTLKSPKRGNWEGVKTERISETEFNILLSQPYAPFIENLTLGILPRHLWEFATPEEMPFSQNNTEPVGAGPYQVQKIQRNNAGIPESYTLKPFPKYHTHPAHIEDVTLSFFTNEDALTDALAKKNIDSAASLSAPSIDKIMSSPGSKDYYTLYQSPLPRTFVLFFNQNENPALRDIAVRKALDVAIDREKIVSDVLGGYGLPIDGPIPPGFGFPDTYQATTSTIARIEAASNILRTAGWKINDETKLWEKKNNGDTLSLKLTISTMNTSSFENTADLLQKTWGDLGVPVDIKKFEQSDFTQSIIRPRKYETLLFGTAVGRELDFYSFWHSSQRADPGLNVALYANITTDSILATARANMNEEDRKNTILRFADEIQQDTPALFLYVPDFTYIAPKHIQNISFPGIAGPQERFSHIEEWYTETESIWPAFIHKK